MAECVTGRCRSAARCLPCIERDGLTRPRAVKIVRLRMPTTVFSHRMVKLAAEGLERQATIMRRSLEMAMRAPRLTPEMRTEIESLRRG